MNTLHPYRPHIPLIPDGEHRPLWSVMIPTYNCAGYLRETLASVLAQDPGLDVMQIEVIDDCSTKDDPRAVVEELGKGRISFYQHPRNVGHVSNFNTCLQRSRGQLVHLLHGDDCVRDGFYQKLQTAFIEHPEIGAAFCRHIHMDEQSHWQLISWLEQSESGVLQNWLERIAVEQRVQTPAIAVRRKVYEKLGGYDSRIRYWGEDWEMWVRIAAYYPVWYEIEPLALYRTHSASLSGHSVRTGENIQDFRNAITIVRDYLPSNQADQLTQKALENYAQYALKTANQFINTGNSEAAFSQIREALKCSTSFKVMLAASRLGLRAMYRSIKSGLAQPRLSNSTRTTIESGSCNQ